VIWALHGFLGRGTDWDALRAACGEAGQPPFETPDLFAPGGGPVPGGGTLEEWGDAFAAHVAARDAAPILLGYSLGGRLGLHALLARPAQWRGAVIVSAHLGLDDEAARAARRKDDARWADRFAREPWQEVLRAWDARDVFAGRAQPLGRLEGAYDRAALAAALRTWSLGVQRPLGPLLGAVPCPVLWLAGEHDRRSVAQGEAAVRYLPRATLRIAPRAAHRVPWETPEWVADAVLHFVGALSPS
jgi:2-succinyl-6-hydroxy-2,4-cyclohexadiene-1-carboxylate synthase